MDLKRSDSVTFDVAMEFLKENLGAVLYVDGDADEYRALSRRSFFNEFVDEKGSYHDLIEKLWFHFNNTSDDVVEDYHVFIPNAGKFSGKYSKRVNIVFNDVTHTIQMTIYPIKESSTYLFILDELDGGQYIDEALTNKKVDTIQNTFLFSMYIDVVRDTTSSISITEISDEVMNQQIKYSDWRKKIVKMIWPADQDQFMERTDPEYLKKNFAPGKTSSFDCLMMNLNGEYIWVKLIFSRAETDNPEDYRFVYMVQDINETSVKLMSALNNYKILALRDSLTGIYNHGRMETEIFNALDKKRKSKEDISLMILDIDFFKSVNDKFGHATGDTTLKEFAQLIMNYCKENNAVAGRWGGEEFVVVCYEKNPAEAKEMAEAIRLKVQGNLFSTVGHITCSIGITELMESDDIEIAFERMDGALYCAKSNGRNYVCTK